MGLTEWALLITLSVLWGGSFFFAEVALRELPPLSVVMLRVGFAALILHVLVRIMGKCMPGTGAAWRAFFGMGLLNNAIPFCLIVWGQVHIASGLAAILNATTPFFTVVLAHVLTTDERLSANRIFGVLIGLAGVVTIMGMDALAGLGSNALAQLAVLGAAVSYAFASIFGRRFKAMGIEPMVTATGQVTASTVLMLPLVLMIDRPWLIAMPGLATWGAIAGIALASTVLGYILYFTILSRAGASNLALVTFLIPPSAILLGAVLLDEVLRSQHIAGMVLIGAGLVAIDGRLPAKLREKRIAGIHR
jgi:drug/metabolite transporter (DMT)-like permease